MRKILVKYEMKLYCLEEYFVSELHEVPSNVELISIDKSNLGLIKINMAINAKDGRGI